MTATKRHKAATKRHKTATKGHKTATKWYKTATKRYMTATRWYKTVTRKHKTITNGHKGLQSFIKRQINNNRETKLTQGDTREPKTDLKQLEDRQQQQWDTQSQRTTRPLQRDTSRQRDAKLSQKDENNCKEKNKHKSPTRSLHNIMSQSQRDTNLNYHSVSSVKVHSYKGGLEDSGHVLSHNPSMNIPHDEITSAAGWLLSMSWSR